MCHNASQVFFTPDISSSGLLHIYSCLKFRPVGRVAIKLHSGEPGGNYFLNPTIISPLIQKVKGTIIDANTPYAGHRSHTQEHYESMKQHGFFNIAPCDIIDEDGSIEIPILCGIRIQSNYVGSHLLNYKSIIIINHFKGHRTAGFGGVIKDMSIGLASKEGKCWIHTAGQSKTDVYTATPQDYFLESMVDAAKSIQSLGMPMVFISFLNNLSADGDGSDHPRKPELADQGILASYNPVALDQACLDLVRSTARKCNNSNCALIERIESLHGEHVITAAVRSGLGSNAYYIEKVE